MNHSTRPGRLWRGLAAAAMALAIVAADATAQNRPGRRRPGRRPKLEMGQLAPDFQLPVLKFETKKDGTIFGRITKKLVKLSSLRGKKAVVLFFSSYT